ncbi:hypothetical protein MMC25_000686 [Agyrium rufum]|nr:hypothetical protein [Agyrium rufum]
MPLELYRCLLENGAWPRCVEDHGVVFEPRSMSPKLLGDITQSYIDVYLKEGGNIFEPHPTYSTHAGRSLLSSLIRGQLSFEPIYDCLKKTSDADIINTAQFDAWLIGILDYEDEDFHQEIRNRLEKVGFFAAMKPSGGNSEHLRAITNNKVLVQAVCKVHPYFVSD